MRIQISDTYLYALRPVSMEVRLGLEVLANLHGTYLYLLLLLA